MELNKILSCKNHATYKGTIGCAIKLGVTNLNNLIIGLVDRTNIFMKKIQSLL